MRPPKGIWKNIKKEQLITGLLFGVLLLVISIPTSSNKKETENVSKNSALLEKQLEEIGATYTEPETTPETPKETPNPSSTIVDEPQIGEKTCDGLTHRGSCNGAEELLPADKLPDWW